MDDYLATRERLGRAAQKPFFGKLMLRVPPDAHAAVATAAGVSGKSIHQRAADVFARAVEGAG